MKTICKLVLFVLSLFGMAMSVLLLMLLYGMDPFAFMGRSFSLLCIAVFATLTLVLYFVLLIASIVMRGKIKDMAFSKEKGHLRFSKQAIASTVYQSFAAVEGIDRARVRVKIKRRAEQSRVFVRLSVTDGRYLVNLSETVQRCIEDTLRESLGIEISAIDVRVEKLAENNATDAIRRDDT